MGMMKACADSDTLKRWHGGELDASEQAELEAHLAACPDCAQRDAELVRRHDTWVSRLRAAGPPPPARAARRPGAAPPEIPGYRIGPELARGGQGVVFRARQISTQRDVAVKLLLDGRFASPEAERRFAREIELAARLRHPNIIAIFDSGVTAEGRRYCVMDIVEGRPLDRWVAAHRPPLRDLLALFARVVEAVNSAHQRGVLHRDLKPSNVLVDADGRPHILDFGLAKPLHETDETLTRTGVLAGTIAYLAPEATRRDADLVDVRSDVYALGVMLYQLLAGDFPYPVDGDTLSTLQNIAGHAPRPWTQAAMHYPVATDADLRTIVFKALAKEPERRYASAGDLARDLRHYLAGEPIEARADSRWYLLRRAARRNRATIAAGLTFVLLLVAGLVTLGVLVVREGEARSRAERQAQIARERFDQVRSLANTFIHELDPLLRHVPGTAPARQLVVETGRRYLDELAASTPEHASRLATELGLAYITLGDVQGDLSTSNTNDLPQAAESYRAGIALLEQTPAPDAGLRHRLCLAYAKLGDVSGALGDGDAARAAFETAMRHADALRSAAPDNDDWRRLEVTVRERRVNLLLADGQTAEAVALLAENLRITEELLQRQPDSEQELRDLAVTHSKLAIAHRSLDHDARGLEHQHAFVRISDQLANRRPNNLVYQRDALIAHQQLGISLQAAGDAPAARAAFDAAIERGRALRDRDPASGPFATALVTTLVKRGELHLAGGDLAPARADFADAVAHMEPVAAAAPEQPALQRLAGVARYKLVEYWRATAAHAADPAARTAALRAAIEQLEAARGYFHAMQERGILPPADAGVPAALAAELADLRARLTDAGTDGG